MLTHLGQIVLEHLIGEQFEDILTAEIHITAKAKLLNNEFTPSVLRHRLHTKVKIRCAAAKVEYTVGDLLTHALWLEPIRLKGTDRVCSRFICPIVHAETAHHLRIVEKSLRQCLSETALKTQANVLTHTFFVPNRKG